MKVPPQQIRHSLGLCLSISYQPGLGVIWLANHLQKCPANQPIRCQINQAPVWTRLTQNVVRHRRLQQMQSTAKDSSLCYGALHHVYVSPDLWHELRIITTNRFNAVKQKQAVTSLPDLVSTTNCICVSIILSFE